MSDQVFARLFQSAIATLILATTTIVRVEAHSQEECPLIENHHPVFAALRSNNADEVIRLLQGGLSINSCTSSGASLVSYALQFGHVQLARNLLSRGFNPMFVYRDNSFGEVRESGQSVLVAAIHANADDIVGALLERGLDSRSFLTSNHSRPSPVHAAIQIDSPAIARKVVRAAVSHDGGELLRRHSFDLLTACKSIAMLELLAELGANIDATDSTLPCPSVLHTFAKRGWHEGVGVLVALDADATLMDRDRRTPEEFAADGKLRSGLRLAALRRQVRNAELSALGATTRPFAIEIMEAAFADSEDAALRQMADLRHLEIEATEARGWTLLTYALSYRFTRLAAALIERGADVSYVTPYGSAMIAFAATTGDTDLLHKMLAKGADIDAAENGKATALIIATQAKNTKVVDFLLQRGAKVEPKRTGGSAGTWFSALMMAAKTGEIHLMERMLAAGADLHAVDSSGENVVSWVARSGNVGALNWLMARGAFPHQKTPHGTNPLTIAASLGHLEMMKALAALGLRHRDVVDFAIRSNNQAVVQLARELTRASNPTDPAELWNRFEISTDEVREYVERGGDVNYSERCPTPLQAMASLGNADAVRLLLKHGANPAKRGKSHNLAVELCLSRRPENKALEILRILVENGVSPNTQQFIFGKNPPERVATGNTILHLAISVGLLRCAEFLLEQGANPSLRSEFTGRNAFDALRDCEYVTERERLDFQLKMERHARPDIPVPDPVRDLPRPSSGKL